MQGVTFTGARVLNIAWQSWLLALLFPVLAALTILGQTAEKSDSQIAVRLTAQRTAYRPGDDIRMKVEIWNKSSHDLFISKELNFSSITALELTVSKGRSRHTEFPAISDSFSSERANYPPLAIELSRYWIAGTARSFLWWRSSSHSVGVSCAEDSWEISHRREIQFAGLLGSEYKQSTSPLHRRIGKVALCVLGW